ncbi:hypothetical protein Trydic_g18371 [Trypoxylus dichotomus]
MESLRCTYKVVFFLYIAWCLLDEGTLLEKRHYGPSLWLNDNDADKQNWKLSDSLVYAVLDQINILQEEFSEPCVYNIGPVLKLEEIESITDIRHFLCLEFYEKGLDKCKRINKQINIPHNYLKGLYKNELTFQEGSKGKRICIKSDVNTTYKNNFFFEIHRLKFFMNVLNGTEAPKGIHALRHPTAEDSIPEICANISVNTDDFQELTAIDIKSLSKELKTISEVRSVDRFMDRFFRTVNNLMQIDSSVLRKSQQQFNSTDKILDSIETFVENMADDITNLTLITQTNLITQVSCPFISNVIGLAIYSNGYNDFSSYKIVNLHWNETFDHLSLENLEVAVYIPMEYIQNLAKSFTVEDKKSFKIVNTVFYNDAFFRDINDDNRSASSRIISVNIPALSQTVDVPVRLLFKPLSNITRPICAFWDYGQQRYGKWSTSGGEYTGLYQNELLMQCSFTHITHFGLLVLSDNSTGLKDQSHMDKILHLLGTHERVLKLITSIGCGLSMAGLLATLATALLFKEWYKKRLNTIQLGITMFMEIIFLYLADWEFLKKVNIAIFTSVMATVSSGKRQRNGTNLQSRLGFMLLFMLGIMWLFGLMGEFLPYSSVMVACLYNFLNIWTGRVKNDIKSWMNYRDKVRLSFRSDLAHQHNAPNAKKVLQDKCNLNKKTTEL